MKLCVIGLGYIGLPTSIMFAKHNVDVLGIDNNLDVINKLNSGAIHIEEPGLQEALNEVLDSNKFKATSTIEAADAFIVAVPTPNNNDEYRSCDLSYVISAVESIIPVLVEGNTIIIESTIGPRSMEDDIKPLLEKSGFVIGEDIFLVHCPERVLPGNILNELIENNRIVGGVTPKCTKAGLEIYKIFVKGEIIQTNAKTAEMSKLMENTFRDVNIALANELTKICYQLEIDALEVISMANKHPRVNLHSPGPGVGGHCLAVDPYFIVSKAPESAKLINLAREINTSMPDFVVNNVNGIMENCKGKIITVFGLTYKGNVDDIRESPAMEIYNTLLSQAKYVVRAYDPYVKKEWVFTNMEEAVENSDLILILSDHTEFKTFKISDYCKMAKKQIYDTKNIVKDYSSDFTYINYGNIFKFTKTLETVK